MVCHFTLDLPKSCTAQVRRVIQDFLWSGLVDNQPRAKLAWDVIILHVSKRGLGIIDRFDHSQALLTKLKVKGLLHGPFSEVGN